MWNSLFSFHREIWQLWRAACRLQVCLRTCKTDRHMNLRAQRFPSNTLPSTSHALHWTVFSLQPSVRHPQDANEKRTKQPHHITPSSDVCMPIAGIFQWWTGLVFTQLHGLHYSATLWMQSYMSYIPPITRITLLHGSCSFASDGTAIIALMTLPVDTVCPSSDHCTHHCWPDK